MPLLTGPLNLSFMLPSQFLGCPEDSDQFHMLSPLLGLNSILFLVGMFVMASFPHNIHETMMMFDELSGSTTTTTALRGVPFLRVAFETNGILHGARKYFSTYRLHNALTNCVKHYCVQSYGKCMSIW